MAGVNRFYPVNGKNHPTTKDTMSTKFGMIIIRNVRVLPDLRGERLFLLGCGPSTLAALLMMSGLFFLPTAAQVSFAAAAPFHLRMGYPQPSGAMLPVWVITEARRDQKYGFNLQNIYISGGARPTPKTSLTTASLKS